MILRRLADAIREQNWFTVVLEVLIVVVGIFIGLQVDDWNQARKDRIDEQLFLTRLHDDLLRADELSSRLRQRRVEFLQQAMEANDVLLGRNQQRELTEPQCNAIFWSSAFNLTPSSLPSLDELIASGRMRIISNSELRAALVGLRQTHGVLNMTIVEKTNSSNFVFLPGSFPDLFRGEIYLDEDTGEVLTQSECDLAAMRTNSAFLTRFTANIDGYDAYLRDGVLPWIRQLEMVHSLVDDTLDIDHLSEAGV